MANLKGHINAALFTYPIAYMAVFFISKGIGHTLSVNIYELTLGYFVYIVGGDLPDIDSKNAPIHHFLKVLASILGVYTILNWSQTMIANEFKGLFYPLALSIIVLGGAVASYGLITLVLRLKIFEHRKFAHSFTFAIIYGAILYGAFYKKESQTLYIAIVGTLGVMLHLEIDYWPRIWKAFKLW